MSTGKREITIVRKKHKRVYDKNTNSFCSSRNEAGQKVSKIEESTS